MCIFKKTYLAGRYSVVCTGMVVSVVQVSASGHPVSCPHPATTTSMATPTPPPPGLSMMKQLKHQCLDHQCYPAPALDKHLF